ncbi:MAG: hypothetical protein JWL93_1392 [Hyphomicrobiales bacterium]|nr:hypothetical protein [Hyphomicrobiales bacterium]
MGGRSSLKPFQALIRTLAVFAAMFLFAPETASAHGGHTHARGVVSIADETSSIELAPTDVTFGVFERDSTSGATAVPNQTSDVDFPCTGGCCRAGACCAAAIALDVPAIEVPDAHRLRLVTQTAKAPSFIAGCILEPPTTLL